MGKNNTSNFEMTAIKRMTVLSVNGHRLSSDSDFACSAGESEFTVGSVGGETRPCTTNFIDCEVFCFFLLPHIFNQNYYPTV